MLPQLRFEMVCERPPAAFGETRAKRARGSLTHHLDAGKDSSAVPRLKIWLSDTARRGARKAIDPYSRVLQCNSTRLTVDIFHGLPSSPWPLMPGSVAF